MTIVQANSTAQWSFHVIIFQCDFYLLLVLHYFMVLAFIATINFLINICYVYLHMLISYLPCQEVQLLRSFSSRYVSSIISFKLYIVITLT